MIFQIINSNKNVENYFKDNFLLRVKAVKTDKLGYEFIQNLIMAAFSSCSIILGYSLIEAYNRADGLLKNFYRSLIASIKTHTIYILNKEELSDQELENYKNLIKSLEIPDNKVLIFDREDNKVQIPFFKVFKKYSK